MANLVNISICTVVEESIEALLTGHQYNKFRQFSDTGIYQTNAAQGTDGVMSGQDGSPLVILEIAKEANVAAKIEVATWQRIILNVVGNALKYTERGHVRISVSLAARGESSSSPCIVLLVSDTGRGMTPNFLRNHLFEPFAQENTFSSGTGLGMSMVKKMVESQGGIISVKSKLRQGTEVAMQMPLSEGFAVIPPSLSPGYEDKICILNRSTTERTSQEPRIVAVLRAQEAFISHMRSWYGIQARIDSGDDAAPDVVVMSEQDLFLLQKSGHGKAEETTIVANRSFIILCTDHEVHERSQHVKLDRVHYLLPPFGPRQTSNIVKAALEKDYHAGVQLKVQPGRVSFTVEQTSIGAHLRSENIPHAPKNNKDRNGIRNGNSLLPEANVNLTMTTERKGVGEKTRILLVDDNHINIDILVMAIKMLGHEYDTATNGLEAVTKFKAAANPFTHVFMDISMPVMDGFQATREIRGYERARGAGAQAEAAQPAQIIAMTGLGSSEAQEEALTSGVNQFLKKPVQIKTIRALLQGNKT